MTKQRKNNSVWLEEVDIGLKKLLSEVVTVTRTSGIYSVPVEVEKPDEDFKIEHYPMITLFNISEHFDAERYNPNKQSFKIEGDTSSIVVEDSAIPYNLLYQIDFWAKTRVDMNEMTRKWDSFAFRFFNLEVKDSGGIIRDCYCVKSADPRSSNSLSGSDRIFRTIYTYKIQVELDEGVSEIVPVVQEVVLEES